MYKGANYLYSNKKKRVFLVERSRSTDDIEFLHKFGGALDYKVMYNFDMYDNIFGE